MYVIGLGYIGLPTATLIAKNGLKVAGIDLNKSVVDTVNSAKVHIVSLLKRVSKYVKNNMLVAHVKLNLQMFILFVYQHRSRMTMK